MAASWDLVEVNLTKLIADSNPKITMCRSILTVTVSIIFGTLALLPLALASCQWSALRNAADTYYESQTSGELDLSYFGAAAIVYKENNKTVDIKKGILSKPLKVDLQHSAIDQTGCASYTELIVTDPKNPFVIATQIHYNPSGTISSRVHIIEMDVIITTTGDLHFNATKRLGYLTAENWGTLPRIRRLPRPMEQPCDERHSPMGHALLTAGRRRILGRLVQRGHTI
jgi:hypothetical protein